MDNESAVNALGALAQPTRLAIFRELVKAHSPVAEQRGLAAGELSKKLDVSASSLSFHLKEMQWNGLVCSQKIGRSVVYQASFGRMQALVSFLLEDCCAGTCGALRNQKTGEQA